MLYLNIFKSLWLVTCGLLIISAVITAISHLPLWGTRHCWKAGDHSRSGMRWAADSAEKVANLPKFAEAHRDPKALLHGWFQASPWLSESLVASHASPVESQDYMVSEPCPVGRCCQVWPCNINSWRVVAHGERFGRWPFAELKQFILGGVKPHIQWLAEWGVRVTWGHSVACCDLHGLWGSSCWEVEWSRFSMRGSIAGLQCGTVGNILWIL